MAQLLIMPDMNKEQRRIAREMIDAIRMADQATNKVALAENMRGRTPGNATGKRGKSEGKPFRPFGHGVSPAKYGSGMARAASSARKLCKAGVNPYAILVAAGITADQLRTIHGMIERKPRVPRK
ncbi:hypothetical protein [Plantactinospora sp. WMMB782]|uniref:hypothetical protein n=1 Tax=Plantactinospora sp. WMMB782 TaxID=3404121 RepID=UPI003B9311CA